jgi:hypothetical protein
VSWHPRRSSPISPSYLCFSLPILVGGLIGGGWYLALFLGPEITSKEMAPDGVPA